MHVQLNRLILRFVQSWYLQSSYMYDIVKICPRGFAAGKVCAYKCALIFGACFLLNIKLMLISFMYRTTASKVELRT